MLEDDRLAEFLQVLRQRLRVMGEIAVRRAVYHNAFYAQPFEQAGHDDGSYGVDRVEDDPEVGVAYRFLVDSLQVNHRLDMFVGEIVLGDLTEVVDQGEIEASAFGEFEDGLSFGRCEELAFLVQELEGVPLAGIVRCSNDDAPVGSGENDGHFSGRSGGESGLDHVDAARCEGAADELLYHVAAQTRILTDHDLVAGTVRTGPPFAKADTVCICEFDDIDWSEALAGRTSDGTPYA